VEWLLLQSTRIRTHRGWW